MSPAHLPDSNGFFEAGDCERAAFDEGIALAGGEFADDVGDEDFAAPGMGSDRLGGFHGRAVEFIALANRFAGVNADADAELDGKISSGIGEAALEVGGGIDGVDRGGEANEEPIAAPSARSC